MDWAGDHLSPLIWHNQIKYHLQVDSDIIFRYQKVFFDIPKLLLDDIRTTGRRLKANREWHRVTRCPLYGFIGLTNFILITYY